MSNCHKNVPNNVSLSHCYAQLYSYILISKVNVCLNLVEMHMKWFKTVYFIFFTFCRPVYWLMRSWQLAVMSCACQLINYTLTTEENVGNVRLCACCNPFPFTLNEFYHNTQPNNFEFSHKAILRICIMKNINLQVSCKWNHFAYWNLCKL